MFILDPVHGQIDLPDFVVKFINTVQFQRLRNIKQLGACSYIFAGTSHSRFEHSVGVSHLANRFIDILERNSNRSVKPFFRKCVVIAGLLHDIGHGPYSHMWERIVHTHTDENWTHEYTSGQMVRFLIAENALRLSDDPDEHEIGENLVVALICGDTEACHSILGDDQFFLSEIVNNEFCLIDVDKWDYLLRDSHHVSHIFSIHENFDNCFRNAKVVETQNDGRTHIAFHRSTYTNIIHLFENRANLHRYVYQHVDVIAIELMLEQIFKTADKSMFRLKGERLTEAQRNLSVFSLLEDSIIQAIDICDNLDISEAQSFISILKKRDFRVEHDNPNNDTDIVKVIITGHEDILLFKARRLPSAMGSMPRELLLYDDDGSTQLIVPANYRPPQ